MMMVACRKIAAMARGRGPTVLLRAFRAGPTLPHPVRPCRYTVQEPLRVTLVEGRGTGPLVCAAVRRVLAAAGVPVHWDRHTIRLRQDPRTGRPTVNADLVESALDTGLVLRGPSSGTAQDGSDGSPTLALLKTLGAYVRVRAFVSHDCWAPYGTVRSVNISDTVSGEYSEIEHTVVPGVVQTIKTATHERSEAVAKFAFDYAAAHGRRCVTALHKANAMRLSDGVFLRACRRVSARYPTVAYAEEKLDKFCLRAPEDPARYDVLLTPSLYGTIASAVCGALSGGPSTVPSVAYGPRAAVFGTMDDGAAGGRERDGGSAGPSGDPASGRLSEANPAGLIKSAAWMLDHVGMSDAAQRVCDAVWRTVQLGVRTPDMGGFASCAEFTDAVISNLHQLADRSTCPAGTEDVKG